jgi:hypothetical protein
MREGARTSAAPPLTKPAAMVYGEKGRKDRIKPFQNRIPVLSGLWRCPFFAGNDGHPGAVAGRAPPAAACFGG